jgi:hypothetical protein
MEIKTLYKVISGSTKEVEKALNLMSQDGWRPVAMSCQGDPAVLTTILENKMMEVAKLSLSSELGESNLGDRPLEEVQ